MFDMRRSGAGARVGYGKDRSQGMGEKVKEMAHFAGLLRAHCLQEGLVSIARQGLAEAKNDRRNTFCLGG